MGTPVAAEPASPASVAGQVFLDASANGKLDPGEKGIPGVRVTDGVGFVTTDADGAAANIESLSVQEVKADPDNKDNRYRCGCAHGALRRNPFGK